MSPQLIAVTVACVAVLVLAILARRGRDANLEEWSVAGRGFGSLFVFLLMAGEIYTTVTFLGTSGYAYSLGGPAVHIMAYACLAYVISYWLLPPVWRYAQRHKLVSAVELYEHLYASRLVGVVVGVVAVAALVPYLAGQLRGLGAIVSHTSDGAVSPTLAMIVGTVVLCLYVMISGIRGSAWTAVAKDLLTLGIVLFLGIYLPLHYFGGYGEMFRQIQQVNPEHLTLPADGLSPTWFSTTVLLMSLGFFIWPHTMGAALTAKDARVFRVNATVSPIYSLLLLFVLFVGFAAVVRIPGLEGADTDLALLRLSSATFDDWLMGLVSVAGLLAALVPGAVILIAMATTIARVFFRAWRPDAPAAQLNRLARNAVPVIALAGFVVAVGEGKTVVTLLLLGYALVTQLLPALVGALLPGPSPTRAGVIAGITTGVAVVIVLSVTTTAVSASSTLGSAFPNIGPPWSSVNLGLAALLVNIAVTLAVSVATRSRPHSQPDNIPTATSSPVQERLTSGSHSPSQRT